ncbi:Conserved_hypothetical protein [Hexamita inflata]|uniref:Uncharacterized protein n=1 Tax=Hexamita inflata TaxID=28002 RepID=A0AA86TLD4_9EUKA|nr:Conserved hypothetical protein [Hexamita inflata]
MKQLEQIPGREIFYNHLRILVISDGRFYLQCGNKILQLTNSLELIEIAEIPGAKQKQLLRYGRIYSQCNRLYCQANNDIYEYDYSLKSIKQCFKHFMCYQWCDSVYFVSQTQIFILGENQKQIELYNLTNKDQTTRTVSFASGGVMVIHTKDCAYVWIVQMQNESQLVKLQNDQRFDISNIHKICTVGEVGLQLKPDIIDELFGWDYFQSVQIQHNQFLKQLAENQNYQGLQTSILNLILEKSIDLQLREQKLQLSYIINQLHERNLKQSQLMNVISVCDKLNNIFYLSIVQNRIYIISKTLRILTSYRVNFNQYIDKYKNNKFLKHFHPYMFTPVIVNDTIYIQYNRIILQVVNNTLKFVSNVPEFTYSFNASPFKRRLFAFKNKLYWSSNLSIFELSKYKTIINSSVKFNFINEAFMFKDCVYIQNSETHMIYELNDDFTLRQVVQGGFVQFWNGGVAIMGKMILNLENMKIYCTETDIFREENFILGNSGLELKAEIQKQIFGYAIQPDLIKVSYKLFDQQIFETRMNDIAEELETLSQKINQQKNKTSQELQNYKCLINSVCTKFTFINDEPETQ